MGLFKSVSWILGFGALLACESQGVEVEVEEPSQVGVRQDALSQVFTLQADFEAATGATLVPFPASAGTAYPDNPSGASDYSCVRTPPGTDLPWGSSAPTLNIQAPRAVPDRNWLCFVGPGWQTNNTFPRPVEPTLVVVGEDDFEIAFLRPVSAVGVKLLTNNRATHRVTLTFTDATQEIIEDSALDTATNTFEFIGFRASKPLRSIFIDTAGGASQNEGVAGVWTAPW
jgi:hypothetical protein